MPGLPATTRPTSLPAVFPNRPGARHGHDVTGRAMRLARRARSGEFPHDLPRAIARLDVPCAAAGAAAEIVLSVAPTIASLRRALT